MQTVGTASGVVGAVGGIVLAIFGLLRKTP